MIPVAVRDNKSNVVIATQEPAPVVVVATPVAAPFPVAAGLRGTRGRDGVGAGGVSYIQDHEPAGAIESETWWNPLTLQLKVYHDNEFEPVSPDGGYF